MKDTMTLVEMRALADECEAWANEATPQPWQKHPNQPCIVHMREKAYDFVCMPDPYASYPSANERWRVNSNFIIAARTAIPTLVAALRAAADEIERLRAPEAHWSCQQKIDTVEIERDQARAEVATLITEVRSEAKHIDNYGTARADRLHVIADRNIKR